MDKSDILEKAVEIIWSEKSFNWNLSDSCQIAYIVRAIQGLSMEELNTPFAIWHNAFNSEVDNPHIIALKEAGFTFLDIIALEMLVGYQRYEIPWDDNELYPIYADEAAVTLYMLALADEWREEGKRKDQVAYLERCFNGESNPCREIKLPKEY